MIINEERNGTKNVGDICGGEIDGNERSVHREEKNRGDSDWEGRTRRGGSCGCAGIQTGKQSGRRSQWGMEIRMTV